MKRKVLSILLALLMVLSLVPTILAPQTTVADAQPIDQTIVQGGAILHCFDWSFDEIRAALPDIKAAGYAAVQTSPVQPPKDYNASWNDTGGNWWKLYQPLDFCVVGENGSWLGSRADLIALCDAAADEGIYVIVDVVANHTANITGGGYTVNGTYNVSDQVAERLQDPDGSKGLYHTSENGTNDDSRYNMTQYHLSMPDLNTGNPEVQNMVLDFLKECVDCGVDGFRFDAAKHIELPGDSGCGSDFWPIILNGVRDYATDLGQNLYIYGESLSGSGSDAWVNEFITYMGLTDSQAGNQARGAVVDQNAGLLAVSDYTRGNSKKDYVIWAESHDTYEDGGSTGVSSAKIIKTWGIVGARADSTSLFLARPNERMGLASSDTAWKSPAVAAVNAFKNHYDGKGEWLSSDQDAKITWIERGTSGGDAGVSIVKLDGAGSVNLDAHLMSSGYYLDEITGNVFTVSGGKISGTVGPTGVAVVYQPTAEPSAPPATPEPTTRTLYLKPNSGWKSSDARFAMYSWGSGQHWTDMTRVDGETEDIYEADLPSGDTSVIFCRMNPATTDNNWNNRWNQTGDLAVPSDKNLFTLAEDVWDGATTTWSAYGDVGGGGDPTPVTEDEGYYLVGTMTGWSVMPEFKMTRTGAETEEYMIEVPLMRTSKPYHSQFKIVYSPDGVTDRTWFPSGFDNNYGDYTGEIPQSGVYTVYFRPNYDGGSDWHDGCIYAERTKFFVTVNDTDKNGTVTVDKDVAAAGETVTVTVTPNEGYALDELVYMCETGFNTGEFDITEIEGNTFEMPAENAAVKATFVQDGALSDGYYLVPDSDPTVENINPAHKLTLFGTDGHVFNDFITYVVTGNFGINTYQIVKVENNEIVPYAYSQAAPIVTTTGVVETVYLPTEGVWMYDAGVSSLSGYYLNIGNSSVPDITADYQFGETETPGLYVLERVLYHSSIFVCELENGLCVARYPAGSYMDTTEVAKDMDGTPFAWGSFDRLVRVSFRPDGQGGDDWFHGYFLDQVLNRVMIAESEHGTVTADKSVADVGETVTLTITPDPGYELDTLTVVNDYNEPVDVTDNAFEMTIWEAKVTATFKYDPSAWRAVFIPDYAAYLEDEANATYIASAFGETVVPPDEPTRDGYIFGGWYVRDLDHFDWFVLIMDGKDEDYVVTDEGEYLSFSYLLNDWEESGAETYFLPWDFANDTITDPFTGFYAKWTKAAAKPTFKTQSLLLDGQIGVKFYMNLDCLTEEEKAASYMTFTISGKGTVPSDPVTFDADNTNSDGTLYGFSCYVNAIQMADTITATFHYGNGQTIEKQYSIMQYYEAFKEHAGEYPEQTKELVRALVCYGYCTQQYLMEAKNLPLGYDEASYAPIVPPGELAEMVAMYEYATIADMIEEDSLLFKICNTNDENIKGISFMLALDSETKMTVTFKPDPSYTGIATCSIDNANEAEMQKVRGRFVAEVPNIPAHKLGEMHRIFAYTGGNCYSPVAITHTEIEASPMSYVYLMLTRTGATENEKNCGAAIYTYWQAAQAYIGE